MSVYSIQSVIDDPLAGCLPLVQEESNGTNLLRSLLLRLRLFLDETKSVQLSDQVIAEAQLVQINRWEYVINEVLYELRYCGRQYNEMFETVVLNNWVKDLLKRWPEDTVLEFIMIVKSNRVCRKR